MILCTNCQFYKMTDPKKKFGLCEVKLPAWIERAELTTKTTNIVGHQEGCDLGKPIEQDDDL
jgi:hypothetical protein